MLPFEVDLMVEAAKVDLDNFEPESEAQAVFVRLQKERFASGDTSSVPTMVAIQAIGRICQPEGVTAEDLGLAAFYMMLLGAERDALKATLEEAGYERKESA